MPLQYTTPEFVTTIADAFYKSVTHRNSRYYYFIGKVLDWANESDPPEILSSKYYEKLVRRDIIYVKEIKPTDIAFVVPNITWISGTVYDQYDDRYSTELIGVNIVNPGTNYSTSTYATVQSVTGEGANITLSVSVSGQITAATVDTGGFNYSNANILVTDPFATGSGANLQPVFAFSSSGATSLSQARFYVVTSDYNVYKCLDNNQGSESTVEPISTASDPFITGDGYKWKFMYNVPSALLNRFYTPNVLPVTTAVSNQFYSNGEIISVSVDNGGSNYTSANTIIDVSGDGLNANLVPVISGGNITGVQIVDGGTGYTYATANIITTDLNASNGAVSVNLSVGDINSLQGSTELLAVDGAIYNVEVISPGFGYNIAPNVIINGDGVSANAIAYVSGGRISNISVITPGEGYTFANVVIQSNDSGVGGSARAILPPKGGHGKNAVKELFANALSLYSTVINERNQGFTVNNNYRQIGIIRDLRTYDNEEYYRNISGSACWVINGQFLASSFSVDDILVQASNGARFVIVALKDDNMLVHAIDGLPPVVGTQVGSGGITFTINALTEPDIDKYSGDILFLDNRLAFTVSEEQAVTLKTILRF